MFARAFQGEQSLGEDFGVVGCVGYGAFCDAAEEVRRMEWTSASERMEFQLTVWRRSSGRWGQRRRGSDTV
jgi:hypothetical protein